MGFKSLKFSRYDRYTSVQPLRAVAFLVTPFFVGVGMGMRHSGAGVGVEPPAAEAGRHLRRRGFRRSGSGLPDLRAFAAAVSLRFRAFRRFREPASESECRLIIQ